MRVWNICALILMLVLPLAQAGTVDAPEVEDGTGDGTPIDPESARDLVKGWIEYVADDDLFRFHIELAGDPTAIFASLNAGAETMRFGFTPSGLDLADGQEMYVRMRIGLGTTTGTGEEVPSCRSGFAAEDEYQSILEQVDRTAGIDGKHYWCDLPAADVGHDANATTTLSKTHLNMHFIQRGPLSGDQCAIVTCVPGSGGDLGGVNEVQHYDRAPDEGYGKDFVLAAPVVEEEPVAGNETLNTTVEPEIPEDDGPEAAEAPMGNETSEDTMPEAGNETLDGSPDDKESPGAALPVLAVALVATVFARRRR